MKSKNILLLVIISLAAFIRIYKINSLPPSIFYDEIDAGYQALVFNKNHTDYYNNKYPIHFHSFGDYRTSLHIYSIAFIQKIINNPEVSIRLTSSIYGILSIITIFLITKSLIPTIILSISPWFIHYNRIGFEASGMIFLFLISIYFWKMFINKQKNRYLYLTCFSLCLMPYFYSIAKLFLLIIVFLFALIWYKDIKRFGFKKLILPFLFSFLILTPMIFDTLNGKSGFRFSYISIFTMPHREQIVDTLRYQDAVINHPGKIGISPSLISKILHNKYQIVIDKFFSNYIKSFSPDFLFLIGDRNIRQGFGGHGLLYLVDIIFLFFGIFYTSKKNKNKLYYLFFWILILSPIPFSLTRDGDYPHATRLILMLPSLVFFIYLGIKYILKKYPKSYLLIIFIYGFSLFKFWHYYYYHYPQDSADVWNSGMKETVLYTKNINNKNLIFSDKYTSFVSSFLFYYPYFPKGEKYLDSDLVSYSNDYFSGLLLDNKYYFGKIKWDKILLFPANSIFIVPEIEKSQVPPFLQLIHTINKKYEMAQTFYLYQLNPNEKK